MLRRSISILVAIVATLVCTQCRMADCSVRIVDVNTDMWDDEATITFVNNDTAATRSLDLILHVNKDFEADSISLDITVFTPDSLRYSERVALPVNARWSAEMRQTDIEVPYRRNVTFAHEGEYTINMTPVAGIIGVEAAGINFQTTKQTE